ncbi:MAG: hypothetical protein BGO43_12685 [Gammaproteobacteria bacterium 39-13]|nr:hypothetical protein [Gammaproteobacteria bacterium]OJV90001.1 MAG: hypothetical protein BGO43_12685 [Gammaproteobacteria bacterium 39-13]
MLAFPHGSYEVSEDISVDGTKIIRRHIGEDGHPLLNVEMFAQLVKARIQAAKELHGHGGNEFKILELERLAEHFFDGSHAKTFIDAKKQRDEAYKAINQRLGEVVEDLRHAKDENTRALIAAREAEKIIEEARIALAAAQKISKQDPTRTQKIKDAQDSLQAAQNDAAGPMHRYMMSKEQVDTLQRKYLEEKVKASRERIEPEIKFREAFEQFYWHNIQKAKQINALLVHYVDPHSKPKSVMKKINQRADDIRAREPRPILENHYAVDNIVVESSHQADLVDLTPEQQTLYKNTHKKEAPKKAHSTPSTIVDERQIWQRNAVRTEVKVNGKKAFVGHRHGSPSPLEIHNEAERQHRTLENVKQAMTSAAKEKFEKLSEEDKTAIREGKKTLNIDMSTMCLLSPIAVDDEVAGITIDPAMRQYRQVEDSRLAYWSLHGRDVILIVDDVPVKVKLNSTFMTIGVNQMRGVNTSNAQKLEERINNRGINQFIDGFLEKKDILLDPDMESMMAQMHNLDASPQIMKYREALVKYNPVNVDQARMNREQAPERLRDCELRLSAAKKALRHPEHRATIGKQGEKEIKAHIKMIEAERARILSDLEKEKPILALQDAYLSLETSNAKLHAAKNALSSPEHVAMMGDRGVKEMKLMIKKEEAARKKTLNIIEKEEVKRDILYRNLAEARQKVFSNNLEALKRNLDTFENRTTPDMLKSNQAYQRMRLFVDALDIYYNQPKPGTMRWVKVWLASREKKAIVKKLAVEQDPKKKAALEMQALALQNKMDFLNRSNYRFQARFAMLGYYLDSFVEWFCKSGEDRTGLLNEQLEAFCIFIEKYGHPPRWENEEDKERFHAIMPHVHNGAPNRETNGFNDDAPGLKVTDSDFEMPTVDYKSDIAMANLLSKSKGVGGDKKFAKLVDDAQIQLQFLQRQARHIKYLEDAQVQYTQWQKALPTLTESEAMKVRDKMKYIKSQVKTYLNDKDPAVQAKATTVRAEIKSLSSDVKLEKGETKNLLHGYHSKRSSAALPLIENDQKEDPMIKKMTTKDRRFTKG